MDLCCYLLDSHRARLSLGRPFLPVPIQMIVSRVHGPGYAQQMSITIDCGRICGSGRFSNVYKAMLKSPVEMPVAVKNVWEEKNAPPIMGIYPEVQVLSRLDHPNIVRLLYHFTKLIDGQTVFCLVLNFMPDDMGKLREKGVRFELSVAALYSYQLFSALAHLAKKKILHLDIKPANLLVDQSTHTLQLGDFGNAQEADKVVGEEQTYQVTRYYRAPEVVFSTRFITSAIDTWAAGCCMAEFIIGRVFFKGKSATEQMKLLVEVFGYPTDEDVKAMRVSRPRTGRPTPRGLEKYSGGDVPQEALEVLRRIFIYNPKKRLSAEECLSMGFFATARNRPFPLPKETAKEEDSSDSKPDN